MNIKGLIPNILPTEVRGPAKTERTIKSDETHDRDANGQQASDQKQEEKKPPMSEAQIANALEHLRNLPATKEHRWDVQLEDTEGGRYVLIKDNLGNVIRRIPEIDLWSLPTDQSSKGQLLHKAA